MVCFWFMCGKLWSLLSVPSAIQYQDGQKKKKTLSLLVKGTEFE